MGNKNPLFKFANMYVCTRCGLHWTDEWDCECDDDCPACGCRHISPYASDDLDEDGDIIGQTGRQWEDDVIVPEDERP